MKLKILNNNKKPICKLCGKAITTPRKVKWSAKTYIHLSCCYNWALDKFKYWRTIKNHLSKYKKDMVIERLK